MDLHRREFIIYFDKGELYPAWQKGFSPRF